MWNVGYNFIVPADATLTLSFTGACTGAACTSSTVDVQALAQPTQNMWDYFTLEYGEVQQTGSSASRINLQIPTDPTLGFGFLN